MKLFAILNFIPKRSWKTSVLFLGGGGVGGGGGVHSGSYEEVHLFVFCTGGVRHELQCPMG